MKKKLNRVLKLNKETLRTLSSGNLGGIQGGATITCNFTCDVSCNSGCQTNTCESCRICPTDRCTQFNC
jgi:hypothetical protein